MFKRRQWIKIAENIILFSVLLLIFWCHFFFASWEWTWVGREFFICEDAAFVTPVCPRLVFGNAHLAHLVKYCIQPLPTKMGRNSVCPRQVSNFCGLDKSTIPPVYLQLSTTLYRPSWAAVHSTFSFIHLLPVVTLSDNDCKQTTAATSFRMSALLTLRTFLVKVKKI